MKRKETNPAFKKVMCTKFPKNDPPLDEGFSVRDSEGDPPPPPASLAFRAKAPSGSFVPHSGRYNR